MPMQQGRQHVGGWVVGQSSSLWLITSKLLDLAVEVCKHNILLQMYSLKATPLGISQKFDCKRMAYTVSL